MQIRNRKFRLRLSDAPEARNNKELGQTRERERANMIKS